MLHKNSSKSKKHTIIFKILKSLEKIILKKFLHKINNQQKITKKHKILNIDLVKDLKPKETVGVLTRKNADLEPIAKWLEHFEVPFQLNSKESNLLDITFGKAMYSALVCLNNLDKDKSIASAYFSNLLLECGYTNQLAYASLLYKKEKSKLFFIEWLQLKTEDEKILFVQDWLNKLLAFQLFKTVEIDDTVIKRLTQFIDNITNTKSIADVFVAWETFVANFLKSDKYKTLNSLADLLTYYQTWI